VSRVQEISDRIRDLSPGEFRELRAWLDQYEDRQWDEQFAAEIADGKWDELADRALRDHREGRSTPL
jgi:hypothetical protein